MNTNAQESPPCEALPRAAYVHVPFCVHRCGYCDFTVVAGKDHLADDYLAALEMELSGLGTARPVDTLFLGGGTPTQLTRHHLARLLELVATWLPPSAGAEISVEANPAGFDEAKMDVLAEFGVNRVSLGVQAFDANVLTVLERDHAAHDVERTCSRLRQRFNNVSLDLMFGVPGQSVSQWQQMLDRGIELAPQHVSTYGLTYEKGTAFWSRRRKGELVPVAEQTEREMYEMAMDVLAAADYEQYELSNFARVGFRCRHNEVYWKALPFYGFGPGAARYVGGRREVNHRSVTTWMKRLRAGRTAVGETETLNAEDSAREAIVLGLRRIAGIQRQAFREFTGFELDQLASETIGWHLGTGWLEDTGNHIRLTREGRLFADSVVVDFL